MFSSGSPIHALGSELMLGSDDGSGIGMLTGGIERDRVDLPRVAVRRGIVSSQPRRSARRKVDTAGLPNAACMKATKSLSDGRAKVLFAIHATDVRDSGRTGLLIGSCQNKAVGSFS